MKSEIREFFLEFAAKEKFLECYYITINKWIDMWTSYKQLNLIFATKV